MAATAAAIRKRAGGKKGKHAEKKQGDVEGEEESVANNAPDTGAGEEVVIFVQEVFCFAWLMRLVKQGGGGG